MMQKNLFDSESLSSQIHRQKKYAWDLDKDIHWSQGIDLTRPFLPLDEDCIVFPGASAEQRLAISQYLGLIINATIAEMENVANTIRFHTWDKVLRSYPVNPEMFELGELFYEEEKKHALAFYRYLDLFCGSMGISRDDLDLLLPKAYGSFFLSAITLNAKKGGHAFWWVVAAVEEVSVEVYRELHKQKESLDPLYVEVHLRHMEEESRHHNYAFLMLEVIRRSPKSIASFLWDRTDLLLGQSLATGWVLAELTKVFDAKKLAHRHPFFQVLSDSSKLFKQVPLATILSRLFVSAPYISLMLNPHYHKLTLKMAKEAAMVRLPIPKPKPALAFTGPSARLKSY